jgi:parvulin-like peptidyl-prolyl isomerase
LLAEEFISRVFDLAKGEVSPPIVTPFGVHLATVTDIDEGTVTPDRFNNQLSKIAFQEVLTDLLRQCQERTPVSLAPGVEIAESLPLTVPPPSPAP